MIIHYSLIITKKYYKGKSVYLLHYPHGLKAEFSTGIIKTIDENQQSNIEYNTTNRIIIHLCHTETGSSGSPILDQSNKKVIGLHKGTIKGKNYNLGVFIKEPIENFYKQYFINNTNLSKSQQFNNDKQLDNSRNQYPNNNKYNNINQNNVFNNLQFNMGSTNCSNKDSNNYCSNNNSNIPLNI